MNFQRKKFLYQNHNSDHFEILSSHIKTCFSILHRANEQNKYKLISSYIQVIMTNFSKPENQQMEYGCLDEADELRDLIQVKKERFRVEIRKSKNKQEFVLKRLKLMQIQDHYSEPTQQMTKENDTISFFHSFDDKSTEGIAKCGEKGMVDLSIVNMMNTLKGEFENGNRQNLESILNSIRHRVTVASQNESGTSVFTAVIQDRDFLKILQEILLMRDYSHLKRIQSESIWILINLCAGKNKECHVLLDLGILNTFKHILEDCEDVDIVENVCWCLGNLAADDAECRERLFQDSSCMLSVLESFQQKLMKECTSKRKNGVMNELVFLLSNLIKKHPMPLIAPLRKILRALKEFFFLDIPEMKVQVVKTFWMLISKSSVYLEEILQLDMLTHIMVQLTGSNIPLVKETLVFFTVIAEHCDQFQRKRLLDAKFQAYLEKAMCNHQKNLKLQSIHLLQTILLHSKGFNAAAEILYQERLLLKLFYFLVADDFQVKTSVLQVLHLFLLSDMGIQKLLQLDYLPIILRLARCGYPQIEKLCLQALQLILQYATETFPSHSNQENAILAQFFSHQGEIVLEHLQKNGTQEIYLLCTSIIRQYLSD